MNPEMDIDTDTFPPIHTNDSTHFNPLLHPDILPNVLSHCSDRTLAALMRTSRSLLEAIITSRYPFIQLDPGLRQLRQPNITRTDLPVDSKWFSAEFVAYISRYARTVEVLPHAAHSCPPLGLRLGLAKPQRQLPVTGRGAGGDGASGAEGGVDVDVLRISYKGLCRSNAYYGVGGVGSSDNNIKALAEARRSSSSCGTFKLFLPRTLVIFDIPQHPNIPLPTSLHIPASVTRLVLEIDLTTGDWHLPCPSIDVEYPDPWDPSGHLVARIPDTVEQVIFLILPNTLRRAVKDFPSTYLSLVRGIAVVIGIREKDIQARSVKLRKRSSNGELRSTQDGTGVERSYGIVNGGQINPSWARIKVDDPITGTQFLYKTWDELAMEACTINSVGKILKDQGLDPIMKMAARSMSPTRNEDSHSTDFSSGNHRESDLTHFHDRRPAPTNQSIHNNNDTRDDNDNGTADRFHPFRIGQAASDLISQMSHAYLGPDERPLEHGQIRLTSRSYLMYATMSGVANETSAAIYRDRRVLAEQQSALVAKTAVKAKERGSG